MIKDPTDHYIAAITEACDLAGKTVLEVGCGTGRITRDLAKHAARVAAVDPDRRAVEQARLDVRAPTVEFRHMVAGVLDFPPGSFDVVIYTLSLHHVSPAGMVANLRTAASLLRPGGAIIVLEPDDGGSFTAAKEQFGAGSGDERLTRAEAIRAMHSLEGWAVGETLHFRTLFQFVDEEEFLNSMLPGWQEKPEAFVQRVRDFIGHYTTDEGIILDAGRRLNLLRRN